MKRNVKQSKLGIEVNVRKSHEEVEAEVARCVEEGNNLRRANCNKVASALAALTDAGVIDWNVGEGWARACLSVRIEGLADASDEAPTLWLTNDHSTDGRGGDSEIYFDLEAENCKRLFVSIFRHFMLR